MSAVVGRKALLSELGYTHPIAQVAAVEVLVAAGLTNDRKINIAETKRERCRALLRSSLVRMCPRCFESADSCERRRVPVSKSSDCEVCAGSNNRLAIDRAARAFRDHKLERLLIVGGSPSVHQELVTLWPRDLSLRLVDGEDRKHDKTRATGNVRWADVVIVWGGTVLSHRVSQLYTNHVGPDARKVVLIRRRGIQALADAIVEHLENRRP